MSHPASPRSASQPNPELEPALAAVELQLAALGDALRERDSASIDLHATELHRALACAVDQFALAARSGGLPTALRHRLANAGGMVAAQRESLARATAALDRAIDVLIPRDSVSLYSTLGGAERIDFSGRSGSVLA